MQWLVGEKGSVGIHKQPSQANPSQTGSENLFPFITLYLVSDYQQPIDRTHLV